jgi:hypothetical protein
MKNNKARTFGKLRTIRFDEVQDKAILQYAKDINITISVAIRELVDRGFIFIAMDAAG